ncbi:hypothetical protein [Sphingomonas phyllosphaerae]|uniref:hypothetical protein n=1 Tax=Sphingomonas phyllosphaerae TaxID=257003 RepID=UPI0024133015|nr:hypothetical protein [Sphingomonas phyllosphaerae]
MLLPVAALMLSPQLLVSAVEVVSRPPSLSLPVCRVGAEFKQIARLSAVPAIAQEFARQHLRIAEKDAPFVLNDVVSGASPPERQFLRAYMGRHEAIVWYYLGGLVGGVRVVRLIVDDRSTGGARWHLSGDILLGPPCAATRALVAGVRSTGQQY